MIRWRLAGPLFALLPPVRTPANSFDVPGTSVFARQLLQVREFNLKATVAFLEALHNLQALQPFHAKR